MAADGVQRLDLKDLDAVLERASVEGWEKLALFASDNWENWAVALIRAGWAPQQVFVLHEPLRQVPNALLRIDSLTSLDLRGNQIGDKGATKLTQLGRLTWLVLWDNLIGNAGAAALAQLTDLTSLFLWRNQISDKGASDLARLNGLNSLDLTDNQISDAGVAELVRLNRLTTLQLGGNLIGDAGAAELTGLRGLAALNLEYNEIGDAGAAELARLIGLSSLEIQGNSVGAAGARAILDSWADPATAERRRVLDLRNNGDLSDFLPAEVLAQTKAQVIIAAWRQRKEQEALQRPLPPPDAAGEPAAHGVQVGTATEGRLTLVDSAVGTGARDDEIGRELHGEVVMALDQLIVAAGRSNVVAEWREAAEATKARLGEGPAGVRVSAILRIERLRSLREADERRRAEPDPLVEPAEAGVAAALRDAVAAANLYVETDPYLAEQQRRLADPGLDLAISTEEAEVAEAEMAALDIADPALLAELRLGRETAAAGGRAGERALAWLAGSWRNVVREMLRQVLAWAREQVKAARAGASGIITIEQTRAVLASMGLYGRGAITGVIKASAESAGRVWRHGEPVLGKGLAGLIMLFLADHVGLLTRLGWSPEFAAQIQRLLAGIAG